MRLALKPQGSFICWFTVGKWLMFGLLTSLESGGAFQFR